MKYSGCCSATFWSPALISRWFACEVTFRCNLSCDFCYNPPGTRRELELEEYRRLADSIITEDRSPGVTLTGGEPLLRTDLEEIAEIFSSGGCPVAVATNGTVLTPERAKSLAGSGVSHFDIGFTDPSHETVMAVTHTVKTGATVTASICLHRRNCNQTGLRVRTAAALGADSVCLNRFVPTGRGRLNEMRLLPGKDDLLAALQQAQEAAEACPVHIYTGIPIEPEPAGSGDFPAIEFTSCSCGDAKWAIDPSGNLRTCEQSGMSLGNLLEITFPEAIKRHLKEIREFRKTAKDGCRFLR